MIPKSKVLSVQKGVMANAKVNYGSSKQSQSVTVNIVKENDDVEVKYGEPKPADGVTVDEHPYANLPPDFSCLLQDRDRHVEAYKLIIHIMQSNPLLVNKLIVADHTSLLKLIQLLTNADDVNFVEKEVEVGCCVCADPITLIDKIFVVKSGVTYNLKYSFPAVVSILDEYKISLKMVIVK